MKFTSFLGGKESLSPSHLPDQEVLSGAGAYCSLLEIGETRLLLDCGCLSSFDEKRVDQLRQEVMAALNGNRVDAILLTHAGMEDIVATIRYVVTFFSLIFHRFSSCWCFTLFVWKKW